MNGERLTRLPDFFKPLFWSYNFDEIDLEKQKKLVIVNSINYGDLKHWRWIKNYYSVKTIREILESITASELRPQAGRLAELLFNLRLNYISRSSS